MAVLRAVLDRPGDHAKAVLLDDAALAQSLGWTHALPLLGPGLKRGDREGLRSAGWVICVPDDPKPRDRSLVFTSSSRTLPTYLHRAECCLIRARQAVISSA